MTTPSAKTSQRSETVIVAVLIALCVAAFLWNGVLLGVMTESLHMNDFGKFYYSARAFLDGADMYAATPATDARLPNAPGLQYLNMNPPHFHLLLLPIARLPPDIALTLWMGAGLFALMLSLAAIAREVQIEWRTPKRAALLLLVVLAFSGTQTFFATGQLSFLLLFAMTCCWIDARRHRWERSGVWLGACLSLKPFLLIFVPYLVATRRVRAASIAVATAVAGFVLGVLVFGAAPYQAWYRALAQSGDWASAPMNASSLSFFTRAFSTSPFYLPVVVKPELIKFWLVIASTMGIITLALVMVDRTGSAIDRAFALLLVAAQLVSPLGWVYYLWLPAGPIAALVARSHGSSGSPSKTILTAGVVGLCWPVVLIQLFQPARWATITVGSVYFWATLLVWIWLLVDWRQARMRSTEAHDQRERFLSRHSEVESLPGAIR
jgi:hypothetical protein